MGAFRRPDLQVALYARTDEDFDRATKEFAHGLSILARDAALLGTGRAAGKALPKVKDLMGQIKEKGLRPVLKAGVVGLGRRIKTFLLDERGTAFVDADGRALVRILSDQGKTFTAEVAERLAKVVDAKGVKTAEEALAVFREILEKEGVDWSKLSPQAQKEIAGIAQRFTATVPAAYKFEGRGISYSSEVVKNADGSTSIVHYATKDGARHTIGI